jgi:hypothetical protein
MQPIHKTSVLKQVRETGVWRGVIAPSNARPGGPWNLGHSIEIRLAAMSDRPAKYIASTPDAGQRIELERYLSDYAYYNCHGELGKRVRFWEL